MRALEHLSVLGMCNVQAHHLLVEHMRQLLAGRQAIAEVLDPHMMSDFHEHPRAQLVLLHSVVCACLRSNPSHRSTVSEVLPLLRKLQQVRPPPPRLPSPSRGCMDMHATAADPC